MATVALRGTARSALELSLRAGEYLVSLKIENAWLAGVCGVGVIGLGAFYIHRRFPASPAERRAAELAAENPNVIPIVDATRNGLERNESGENNPDPEVMLIENGSILVKLVCHTEESLLKFLDDFEAQRINRSLEKEFRKLGFSGELQVTITNWDAVRQRLNQNRSESGLVSGPETTEWRSSTAGAIVPLKFECERPEVLKLAAQKYLQNIERSPPEKLNGFVRYLQEKLKVRIIDVRCGSLIVTVECSSREIFEDLWEDYTSGNIDKVANKFLVTEEILVALGLGVGVGVLLTTTISATTYTKWTDYFARKELQKATQERRPETRDDGSTEQGVIARWGTRMFVGLGGVIGGVAGLVGDMAIIPVAVAIRGVHLEGPSFTEVGVNGGMAAGVAVGEAIFGGRYVGPRQVTRRQVTRREDSNE